jgi:hypothetical protein
MRTNVPHVFAIGDIVGVPMLAHKATHEAKLAAEVIAGMSHHVWDALTIPSVAYTDPEVAWMGLTETETEAKAKGVAYDKAVFNWAASGRALGMGLEEGLTKMLFAKDSKKVLSAGIVGINAGELIAETVLALEMGADAEDLSLTIHAHPTLSETIYFAAEIGRSGLRVSLCLGTMTFGEDLGWVPASRNRTGSWAGTSSSAQFHRHRELLYEELLRKNHRRPLGRHRARRDRRVIATKFSGNLYAGDPNGGGSGRKSVRFAASSNRLFVRCAARSKSIIASFCSCNSGAPSASKLTLPPSTRESMRRSSHTSRLIDALCRSLASIAWRR